jgi:HEAT repeat protein
MVIGRSRDRLLPAAALAALIATTCSVDDGSRARHRAMVALLEAASNDSHWEVRHEAGRALSWMGRSAVPILLDGLESRDPETRRASMEVVQQIGPEACDALPYLMSEALAYNALPQSERDILPDLPLWALASLGPGAAVSVPLFVDALEHGQDLDRPRAAEALAGFGPAAAPAMPALVRALGTKGTQKARFNPAGSETDEHTWLRKGSAEALGGIGPLAIHATPALVKALEDPSIEVRIEAARALGRIGHPSREVVMGLLDANWWPTGCIRMNRMGEEADAALEALLALGKDAMPFLTEALETERRLDAAKTLLAMVGTDEARDPDDAPANDALETEPLLKAFGRLLFMITRDTTCGPGEAPDIEEVEVVPLEQAPVPDVQEIIDRLRHGSEPERELAAMELGEVGDPAALPALIEALDEPLLNPTRYYNPLNHNVRILLDRCFNWIDVDRTAGVRVASALAIGQILRDDLED